MNPNPSFNPSPNRNPKPNRHPDPNPSPNPSPNHCPYLTLPLPGPLMLPALMLPALPFTILMPALSLLLVFRTNTGYARWNEVSESDAVILTLLLTGTRLAPWGLQPYTHPWLQPHASGLQPHASRRARYGAASSTTAATLCAGATRERHPHPLLPLLPCLPHVLTR